VTEQKKLEIAGRLRQLYEESDETYLSIADALDVRERTVAAWLSPTSPEAISYKSAKKYAQHFGVTINWLWRGQEEVTVPADFMERFAELERQVQEMQAGRAVTAARQASRKSPLQGEQGPS
jgi:transcriptional regulator with XRE-family HTH domain